MAHWLLQVVLWYGLVSQFQQSCCFGDTRPGVASSEKTFEFRAQHNASRNLQRKKGFVGVTPLQGAVRRFNDMTDGSTFAAINVTRRKSDAEKTKKRETCYSRRNNIFVHVRNCGKLFNNLRRRRRLRYSRTFSIFEYKDQIPDYDFEDKNEELPFVESDDIKTPENASPSSRYFYRNDAKKLVNEAQKESEKYYNEQLKKRTGRGMIIDPSQLEAERDRVRQYNKTVLQAPDTLETPKTGGPSFKDTMLWVNMMRGNRGWYPKGTSP